MDTTDILANSSTGDILKEIESINFDTSIMDDQSFKSLKSIHPSLITSKVLDYIPEEAAVYYQFVPIGVNNGVLEVGIIDPDNISGRDALNFISSKINLPFKTFIISRGDFDKIINLYKGLSGEVTKALSELETELLTESEEKAGKNQSGDKKE